MRSTMLQTLYNKQAAILALAVAAAFGFGTQSTQALTMYEAIVECPIDGHPFVTTMVGAYSQSGMRLDFKPVGALIAPHPLPVCPGNGFVVYRSDFSDSELHQLRLIVQNDEYRRLRNQNTDYFMVAYVKERMGANAYELGSTYLRASWEAERDAPNLVRRYRELALEHFNGFTAGKRIRTEEWWTASVLAAELDRLLGNFGAVELRLTTLPLAELTAAYPELKDVVDQIRMHALRHNSQEQMHLPGQTQGTIGLKTAPPVN